MVRKTSSGLFASIHQDLPHHITRGYNRPADCLVSNGPPQQPDLVTSGDTGMDELAADMERLREVQRQKEDAYKRYEQLLRAQRERHKSVEDLHASSTMVEKHVQTSCIPTRQSCYAESELEADSKPTPEKPISPGDYTKPYIKFMTENPTVFHAVDTFTTQLKAAGYEPLSEREMWTDVLKAGGKYYVTRNGSAFIAFSIGADYKSGNGIGIVAGHIDALTVKLKPIPKLPVKAGYIQMAVAPYGGGLNSTWWDRDLGIGGKVLVKDAKTGKVETQLVKLNWPIAHVPTLAPHFGALAYGPFNPETQMVPIIGVDNSDLSSTADTMTSTDIKAGTFAATQPEGLVRAIAAQMDIDDFSRILNWELELFDVQPAAVGGLNKDLIFAGRIDDKLCCYAAVEALLASPDTASSGIIKMVGCFDDEEIGSFLRQGANSNFMSSIIERIVEAVSNYWAPPHSGPNLIGQTLANSFLVSSDVIHAVNPNFLGAYLENHAPRLNVGVAVSADPNGHMTTDSVSTALLSRVAEKCHSTLQVFQIRNDSRSGGTIGPMTSSRLGCRAVDAGIPQLSMHSIRATTGALDPGLGVKLFKGFFDFYEEVDADFAST